MARSIAALAILALAALAPSAAPAFHDPPYPTISDDALGGDGWVSYRFTISEATDITLEIEDQVTNARQIGLGVWILEEGQSPGFFLATFSGSTTDRHVQLPVGTLIDQHNGGANGLTGIALGFEDLAPGTYTSVHVAASSGGGIPRSRLYGGEAVTLVNKTSGRDAFAFDDHDFAGTANVHASQPTPVVEARATAIVDASVSRTTEGSLFGWFGTSGFNILSVLGYDGPSGSQAGGAHYFYSGAPAGAYTLRAEAVVGATFSGIWAWGAGVTLA